MFVCFCCLFELLFGALGLALLLLVCGVIWLEFVLDATAGLC